ncbi:SDR family NAD(P)-dependent oxidoreductase [Streptomyces sp. NPDC020472]|uniref:SDR family NAD(P)-dependent oxidoreductase n=1 Tax=Streptomyces sp. NPDC020472 TaxID=3365075 RepID=UPI003798B8D2
MDVLINNAGASGRGIAPADVTVEEVHSVYDVNVYGQIRATNAFLPLLRAADQREERRVLPGMADAGPPPQAWSALSRPDPPARRG